MEEPFLSDVECTWVNDVRQTKMHPVEPLVAESCAFEFELTIKKLKRHKSPGIDQIPAELVKSGRRTISYEIYKYSVALVRERTIPTERPPPVDEVSANFCG